MSKKMNKERKAEQIVSSTEEIIKDGLGATELSFHYHRFLAVAVLVSSSMKCLNL